MLSIARRKKRLAALLEKRRRGQPAFDYAKVCHPKQASLVRALVERTARYIAALAGRQSGKSHGATLGSLLLAKNTADVAVIYVTSTDASVRKMAYEPAKRLNRDNKLGGRCVSSPNPTITFPNGSVVYFIGADSERTIERLRGTPNLILCVIDECGLYDSANLKKMIEAVTPGLRPLAGALVLMGTPSLEGDQGTWYDATRNEKFEQHRFLYLDNDRVPSFDDAERLIDEELVALGYVDDEGKPNRGSAYFLREYLCEFVVELAERVYQLTEANLYDGEPPDDLTQCVVGGDVGVNDADAVVSLRWNKFDRRVWAGDEDERSGQDALGYKDMVETVWKRRRPFKIVVDPGGGGAKTTLTIKNLSPGIPIKAANKPPVAIQVRFVNVLLQSKRLMVKRGSQLHADLVRPTWVDGKVGGEIDEHGKHSNLAPCLRYAAIEATPYLPANDVKPVAEDVAARQREWAEVVKQAERDKQKKRPLVQVVLGRRRGAA